MSDLDEKLRELLQNYNRDLVGSPNDYTTETIAQVKQAFKDEGYIQVPTVTREDESGGGYIKIHPEGMYFTGEYWYLRFEKELDLWEPPVVFPEPVREKVKEAAKKAAGL